MDFVLGGNKDFVDFVGKIHGFDALKQSLGDFGFVTRIGVDDKPAGAGIVGFGNHQVIDRVASGFGFFLGFFGGLFSRFRLGFLTRLSFLVRTGFFSQVRLGCFGGVGFGFLSFCGGHSI